MFSFGKISLNFSILSLLVPRKIDLKKPQWYYSTNTSITMVRNTTGGSKTKAFARKNTGQVSTVDYAPRCELEKTATVTKLYGNGMCQVLTTESPQLDLLCHIRGKFRGRSKKQNMIVVNSRIVIGLRDWENPYKNCDLISVSSSYEDVSVAYGSKSGGGSGGSGIVLDNFTFSNEESNVFGTNPHASGSNDMDYSSSAPNDASASKEDIDIDIDDI